MITNTLPLPLTPCYVPAEMLRHPVGVYSISYYGEGEGTVLPWSGLPAATIAEADAQEAMVVAIDNVVPGEIETVEVRVVIIDAEGEGWLLDSARA